MPSKRTREGFEPEQTGKGASASPIDLSHLARQTMDDPELQREVLGIFVRQAQLAREDLRAASGEDRKRFAHKLKGAAQAVGAFAVAECAMRLMEDPADTAALERLDGLVTEICKFVTDFDL